MRKFSNKKIAAVAVGAVALTGTGVAYAYWTTSGSGTGSAAAAAANGVFTVTPSWAANALHPGGDEDVTFTVKNNSTESDLHLTSIRLASGANGEPAGVVVAKAAGNDGDCVASDFTMADVAVGRTVAAGETVTLTQKGDLNFANSALSQDGCKGATITLNLISS